MHRTDAARSARPRRTRPLSRPLRGWAPPLALALAAAGCTLAPEGTRNERERVTEAGRPYEPRPEDRALPELPAEPTWRDVLHRALLANGDLEAAYFDWKAAVERIDIASAYPNSNVTLGYSYTLSSAQMKTFDRMTFSAGFDPMESLAFPTKITQQGKIALDEARAAGERFRAAKFDLQKRVLTAWSEYTLLAEQARIQREQAGLAAISLAAARAGVEAGRPQQDLLRAQLVSRTAEDPVRTTEARLAAQRAQLNAMLARDPDSPLAAPPSTPPGRVVPDDAALLAAAVDQNPELGALARQAAGRADALELARRQWIPDINPSVVFTGDIAQAIGAAITLPTTIPEIRAGIREAQAGLRAGEASLRQARLDRAGSFVAALVMLRDAERRAGLFDDDVLPLTGRVLAGLRESYAAGLAPLSDLLDAQSLELEARLTRAEARAEREQRLAEIEALMGTDIETLLTPRAAASGQPTEVRHD
jgi:outer membrane protein TolC